MMGTCRVCGCTDLDCSACVDRTGQRCWWLEPDLCSACDPDRVAAIARARAAAELRTAVHQPVGRVAPQPHVRGRVETPPRIVSAGPPAIVTPPAAPPLRPRRRPFFKRAPRIPRDQPGR